MYRQSEKNLLNTDTSSTCPHKMVYFGLLTAEIRWRVWGIPANFNGFRILAALLHGTLVVGVSQTFFVTLNRGRHLYSAGRPSRWALAHISSLCLFYVVVHFFWMMNVCLYCVRFSFSIQSQEIGLGNVSKMTCFVLSGTQHLKSVNQSITNISHSVVKVLQSACCVCVFCVCSHEKRRLI